MTRRRLASAVVFATAIGLAVWAFAIEPASLTTRTHELTLPDWPRELSGLRVAVVSDLHVGSPFNGLAKLEEIVARTNELRPDLVLLPGDFVEHVLGGTIVAPAESATVLAKLTAPLGVWATLGNHDWWYAAPRVAAALEKHRIGVLEDRATRITRGASHFWLVGVSDFEEGPHDVRRAFGAIDDDAAVLAFTHNPDLFPTLTERFNLLIAGHTHGGQVFLPLLGRPIVPSHHGQRYAYGHVVKNGRHLFVSPGLGTSILPVRFRVPPEITVLELKAGS